MDNWQLTVGLEVHIQLSTKTKMFCQCIAKYGEEPNSLTCPICLAMPGALPIINQEAINMAIKLSHALDFDVNNKTSFSRKNYYYPDLPKGYQITQFNDPICKNGKLEIECNNEKYTIGITRAHLEEDSGKLIHHSDNVSFVDLNRAGSPLIEIVSEPDLHSSEHAKLYLEKLKQIVKYINISDCDMEKGNLRVDINVSVNKKSDSKLGTRREVKNVNSFRSVQKAIEFEYKKQIELIESGQEIEQSTLTWDEKNNVTKVLRKKEDAHDYRYFPEPDLPHLYISNKKIDEIGKSLPELPNDKLKRFSKSYGLKNQDLIKIISDVQLADYFESLVELTNLPQQVSNWILGEILAYANKKNISINDFPIDIKRISELIITFNDKKLTNVNAKKIFMIMLSDSRSPNQIMKEEKLMTIHDDNFLVSTVENVFKNNENEFNRLKNGEMKLVGFFMGQIMKEAKGKADPKSIQEIINQYITDKK
jgi:aspartyl-tRNA(Asn)/glutamyl-tRNA(Gln) amidotransferase subunit B